MSPRQALKTIQRKLEERLDQGLALLEWASARKTKRIADPSEPRFAIIVVNFSTTRWLLMLLLSLCEMRDLDKVTDIVVVDNHSKDGGTDLLRELSHAIPKLSLVENHFLLSHARGMRLGIKQLERQKSQANTLLFMDSDVIFLRTDTIQILSSLFAAGNALAGEMRHGIFPLPEAQASFVACRRDIYHLRSTLPWVNHGSPSYWMQSSIRRAGLPVADFPFHSDLHVLHRGRSGVMAASEHYPLSSYSGLIHEKPHFMGHPEGENIWTEHEHRWSSLLQPDQKQQLLAHLSRFLI